MRNRVPTSQREVDRLCGQIWNDAVRGRCMMQGIKTRIASKNRYPTQVIVSNKCRRKVGFT